MLIYDIWKKYIFNINLLYIILIKKHKIRNKIKLKDIFCFSSKNTRNV